MAEAGYDHAVIGSTPLAGLLAALLAERHKRRVVLVGAPFSPFRLQRSIDASIGPYTRPETLRLAAATAAETLQLVNGLAKGLVSRVDALFVAETPESIAALGHFRHLAAALGHAVEPVADHNIAHGAIARVRGVQLLNHGQLEPALEAWLDRLEVPHLDGSDTAVTLRRDGGARLVHGGRSLDATQAILADDGAILAHLPAEALERSLLAVPARTLLVEPGKQLVAPLLGFLDRGVELSQEGRGAVAAIVTGDPATARARLAASLPRPGEAHLAGEAMLRRVRTADGAPFVGPARVTKSLVIAGLGTVAAFLAPALARHIAGAAKPEEAAWFAARGPLRGNGRLLAADYAPVPA